MPFFNRLFAIKCFLVSVDVIPYIHLDLRLSHVSHLMSHLIIMTRVTLAMVMEKSLKNLEFKNILEVMASSKQNVVYFLTGGSLDLSPWKNLEI